MRQLSENALIKLVKLIRLHNTLFYFLIKKSLCCQFNNQIIVFLQKDSGKENTEDGYNRALDENQKLIQEVASLKVCKKSDANSSSILGRGLLGLP